LKLKQQLSSQFHRKDLGELSFFPSLEIVRMTQGVFITKEVCARFGQGNRTILHQVTKTAYEASSQVDLRSRRGLD